MSIIGKLAYAACSKHPTMASRTLARKLHDKHPDVYSSIEHARSAVRRYRGQEGNHNRGGMKKREYYSTSGDDRRGAITSPVVPSARILVFDIETSPNMAYVWGCLKQYINPNQLIATSDVMCWAAKWLGERKVIYEARQHDADDHRICEVLRDLFNEADIVVAHNGRAFDIKRMNTRWIRYGIDPPSPYQVVDTCKLAQSLFSFSRSKLESIAQELGLGGKAGTGGFETWIQCMAGDEKAWKRMGKYCRQDVTLLEQVYLRMRAWDKRSPNVSLDYDDVMRCIVCGSPSLKPLLSDAKTAASKFLSYRCGSCGHVMRSRSRIKPNLPAKERLAHVQ
jgi:DNA polymerase elongation subunit (family B)